MPVQLGELYLFSVDELAEKLQVTRLTIRTYCREGRIRARKIGNRWYVSQESLNAYFNETARPAGGSRDERGSLWG